MDIFINNERYNGDKRIILHNQDLAKVLIRLLKKEYDFKPTEISRVLGIKSRGTVYKYLKQECLFEEYCIPEKKSFRKNDSNIIKICIDEKNSTFSIQYSKDRTRVRDENVIKNRFLNGEKIHEIQNTKYKKSSLGVQRKKAFNEINLMKGTKISKKHKNENLNNDASDDKLKRLLTFVENRVQKSKIIHKINNDVIFNDEQYEKFIVNLYSSGFSYGAISQIVNHTYSFDIYFSYKYKSIIKINTFIHMYTVCSTIWKSINIKQQKILVKEIINGIHLVDPWEHFLTEDKVFSILDKLLKEESYFSFSKDENLNFSYFINSPLSSFFKRNKNYKSEYIELNRASSFLKKNNKNKTILELFVSLTLQNIEKMKNVFISYSQNEQKYGYKKIFSTSQTYYDIKKIIEKHEVKFQNEIKNNIYYSEKYKTFKFRNVYKLEDMLETAYFFDKNNKLKQRPHINFFNYKFNLEKINERLLFAGYEPIKKSISLYKQLKRVKKNNKQREAFGRLLKRKKDESMRRRSKRI